MDTTLSEELQIIIKYKKNLINEINQLKLNLDSKEYELKQLKSYLYKNCPHKFEMDYVSLFKNGLWGFAEVCPNGLQDPRPPKYTIQTTSRGATRVTRAK